MSRRQFRVPERPHDRPLDETGCGVMHVDMDAFYASVTLRHHPELVGTPVIIGGGERGVVLSATYEARAFGVTSAMPMVRARRLCPRATVLAPDHHEYSAVSKGVMRIFEGITPFVEPISLDEAFLDVSGATRLLGAPTAIAERIRAQVRAEQGITCSVGIASTKFVAKLASGLAKPDGVLLVPADEVVDFVQQLPVGALWGVGDRTEETLARLGLRTVADIAQTPLEQLVRDLGAATGAHLHDLAWGRDPRHVQPVHRERSIGHERTFSSDVGDPEVVRRVLLGLAEKAASRLRAQALVGRTVSIKVRFSDFTTITRSRSLSTPTDVSRDIYAVARELYDGQGVQKARIRLVGVRVEGLSDSASTPVQGLLDEPEHGWRDADRAVDRASARFGTGSVQPASLIRGGRSTTSGERDLD
ncbi:DNA polymerase IV [Janibacter melonis]|uniref:DNA polymerase IV n=1 Tax=Janibacter melonis TaxID=262209 RepID=UPI00177D840E|nr:DNA polymerase IV [Janibacter melonis]